MSTYIRDFKQIHEYMYKNRIKALQLIFNYLELDDLPSLIAFYTQENVKQTLLRPEIDFLDGIARRHYGSEATDSALEKKATH